jgi:hypothetical protein
MSGQLLFSPDPREHRIDIGMSKIGTEKSKFIILDSREFSKIFYRYNYKK